MLRSPGHSPRQLSPSPAPSTARPSSPTPSSASASALAAAAAATSSSSKRRRPEVLDEDTYVAAIERIIERDFFPDLPRLRDRLDWLQALRSRDPLVLRDAQLKILDRRRRVQRQGGPVPTPTPATSTALRSPSFLATPSVAPSVAGEEGAEVDDDVEAALSLDDFFRRFTSEDNESFSRILEKVNHRRRERYAHLLEPAEAGKAPLLEDAKRDRITDGYGTSGQPPSTLEGAKFTAKNLLMYYPADRGEVPLTDEERAERLKFMTKEINRSNTRFHGRSSSDDGTTKEEEAAAILYAPVAGSTPGGMAYHDPDKAKKYDLEDLRKTPNPFYVESGKNANNGYSFVRTPSPAPGVDESPFMTWGEIDGTPLRLDPEDTPGGSGGSDTAHFKIPPPPARDVKAHLLSRDAARKIKERTKMFHKPPLPSPVRGGSASPRTFSPAAQKFVRNAIAKSSRTIDESLRASYRGASPSASTPKTRFSRDPSLGSRSPSTRQGSTPPW
uniref:DGCR14 protein n=1 Tax=Leersia perrieri TaxID=77586 RepID=A0A0D9WQN1_9ORYZ